MNQSTRKNLPKNIALPNLADNLGIKKLQAKIYTLYSLEKQGEINLLTALFVEYLADNLELIQKPADVVNRSLVNLTCFSSLPTDFPQNIEIPVFLYGDKVSHESIEDHGIIIGRFYAFDYTNQQWRWKYLIYTNQDLAINTIFSTSICWEKDLQPFE
ncbi:MAG: hypothetical protein AAFQ80_21270 [Cyanobacteria bacterium J06621_8]